MDSILKTLIFVAIRICFKPVRNKKVFYRLIIKGEFIKEVLKPLQNFFAHRT